MKIFELFSGFIAAIVIALGAGLYVNQDASVGEELVVEETVRVEAWFDYVGPSFGQLGYDPHDPELYQIYEGPNAQDGPTCTGNEQVCAVKATVETSSVSGNDIPSPFELQQMANELDLLMEGSNIKTRDI